MNQIRQATYNDIPNIMGFLSENWRSSILSKDKSFFEWMFCNNLIRGKEFRSNTEIDFLIAEDGTSIIGCLGTLQSKSFCSETDPIPKIVWLTNWLNIRRGDLTGIKLLKYAEKIFEYDVIGTIGCSERPQSIYKSLGYECGKMHRLVSLNPNKEFRRIISTPNGNDPFEKIFTFNNAIKSVKLERLTSINDIHLAIKTVHEQGHNEMKSPSYYINRYCFHPIYNYKFYTHMSSAYGDNLSILIIRECTANMSKALRIVEIIGNITSVLRLSKFWLNELFREGAEFIDLYHTSCIDTTNLCESGFIDIDCLEGYVVPGYFEPFVSSNPTILSAFKAKTELGRRYTAYKGDCDQDRPS